MRGLKLNQWLTALTAGFALFAMFFGAGNLILPPFIGLNTGSHWYWALAGFFITAIVAPFLGVLMVARVGKHFTDLGWLIHPKLISALTFVIILFIGPLLALPRTGATTYEIGIQPLLPNLSPLCFSISFFGVALVLSISKSLCFSIFFFGVALVLSISTSRIVDVIGKFLTPFLLIVLILLIFLGVVYPEAEAMPTNLGASQSFVLGFTEGYQTMDVMASVIFAGIIIAAIVNKGYNEPSERTRVTIMGGVVSTLCLLFIYGGLIYLGAHSGYEGKEGVILRTDLLLYISHNTLGKWGTIGVALAIGLACLTTAIALISSVSSFFEGLTRGRVSYKVWAVITTVVSIVISVNSVDSIIAYAVYILLFVYPIVFTIILYVLVFGKWVQRPAPYVTAVVVTAIVSAIDVAGIALLDMPWWLAYLLRDWIFVVKQWLPLGSFKLEWLLPSLLAFVVVAVVTRSSPTKRHA